MEEGVGTGRLCLCTFYEQPRCLKPNEAKSPFSVLCVANSRMPVRL